MKHIIALYVLLLALSSMCLAEEPEEEKKPKTDAMLFGDVKSDGQHIPFATITIKGTAIGTAADVTGHFKITNLPVGKQSVLISAVGYKTKETDVQLVSNKSVTILVELETDNIGLEQVVVSADRNSKSRRETPTIVNSINPKLFQRTQNVTLSEGLNFAPGIRMENNCQNCGFSQVRMNGLEGPYSQILINSRPVFSGLAGVYGLELIPANMIERVEVMRGGGSAMYGSNAIAGTINLITKDPVTNNFGVSSNYGVIPAINGGGARDYNLNFNGSFVTDDYKTGMSLFGFTRIRNPFDANGDDFSELALIENTTLGARIFQRIGDRGKLTFDYFNINEFRRGGNKFEALLHESDISESVDHKINSGAVSFDLLMRESDKFSAFFSAQDVSRGSYYGANYDPSAYGQTNDFTYTTGLQYTRQLKYFMFSPATITSGIESIGSGLKDNKLGYYDVIEDAHVGNTLVADQQIATQATFLQSEWKKDKLILTAGLRFDHYNIKDKTLNRGNNISGNVFSPRINLLYDLSEHLQFRLGFARGFRAPQIFDEDLHIETSGSRKVIHKNDTDLIQESSNSFSTSLDFSTNWERWQIQFLIEGFYTQLVNPFANAYGTPDETGVVVYTRTNAEDGATVKGFNLEFNASPSARLQLQSGLTIQSSRFETAQEFGEVKFFRSPDRYGYVSMNYSSDLLFNIAVTGNYSGPMLVPYFGPELANPEIGQLNESDSFFDAGLKLTYDIKMKDAIKIQLNGGIKNVFNSYQNDFDYGIDRDPAYVYGPLSPRTFYFGLSIGNL